MSSYHGCHRKWCALGLVLSVFIYREAVGVEPSTQERRPSTRPVLTTDRQEILKTELAQSIHDGMTLGEIVALLGPSATLQSSSAGIMTWTFSDGRTFHVWPHTYEPAEVITFHGLRAQLGPGRMWFTSDRFGTGPTTQPATRSATAPVVNE